ncbi:hypothetical protein [Rhodohalobacter sp. 8-1]|uniref:hypothetical protein n=1 Tax=Rhodohalobacter sp. 8-1 TaxID=3131972 RepID=UPI0030EC4D6A
MIIYFRTYSSLIILAVPIFFFGTTVQHSVDLDTWLPVEQTSSAGNSFAEVLEELSSEDDIHSTLLPSLFTLNGISDSNYLKKEYAKINRSVPTPPPDHS